MATLAHIASVIEGTVDGDGNVDITHPCEISAGTPGGITFIADPKYTQHLKETDASAVIASPGVDTGNLPTVRVANPSLAFSQVSAMLKPEPAWLAGIHPSAVVSHDAQVGPGCAVGPNVVIGAGASLGTEVQLGAGVVVGANCHLGDRTKLYPRVVLYHGVTLGANTIIHAGAVIGADGFGYTPIDGKHHKLHQAGGVVVGKDVEIGANSAIDRGTIGDTVIGDGTKIDNLVHIAHNVKVGQRCLLAGEVGIAGSSILGDDVTLAGQVGVIDHVTIGNKTVVVSKSAVMQSLEGGRVYGGIPAVDQRQWLRQVAAVKRLRQVRKVGGSSI